MSAFMLAVSAPPVAAQVLGPGRPSAPPVRQPPPITGPVLPAGADLLDGPYVTTRSVSGEVRAVNFDAGYIIVFVPKRGTGRFYVGDKTRLKADKGTPLGDKKRLTLEDFQKGQTVKVTFWPRTFYATEVRVRQPKN